VGWGQKEEQSKDRPQQPGPAVRAGRTGNIVYRYSIYDTDWYIDFTKLDTNSYILKSPTNDKLNIALYMKASVDEKIYFTTDDGAKVIGGQWSLVTLNDIVPMELVTDQSNIFAIYKALEIMYWSSNDKDNFIEFLNFNPQQSPSPSPLPNGARSNIPILNLIGTSPLSIVPAGAVIPMQSNIYTYGPYYYNGLGQKKDDSGGVETVKYDILAPWNFYNIGQPNDISGSFERMDCAGVHLAKDSSKGLQQLEKGRLTIAHLPIFNLGDSVDDDPIFSDNDGPTILTDISVDYGSSGYRTTYNFETYTPRFGRTSKHILDSWTESIKENQLNSQYLREEKQRVSSLGRNLQKNIGIKNKETLGKISPIYNHKSTPNKLLISGYYFNTVENWDDSVDFSISPSVSQSEPNTECDPCK
jgi:hypothetical protein